MIGEVVNKNMMSDITMKKLVHKPGDIYRGENI